MPGGPTETAESIRQQGNEQYRTGKYKAAADLYRKASQLAPTEFSPLSNLSIALFEAADYEACNEACSAALSLLADESQHATNKQKTYARQIKALLAIKDIAKAREVADMLVDGPEKANLLQLLSVQLANQQAVTDIDSLHTRLILELPRYKPAVRTVPEYYSYGHDAPQPLYTSDLLKTDRKKISLLFGGIGDARHLHCSLLQIMGDEVAREKHDKLYHFTIVDLKPAVIARDLVVFLLLSEISDFGMDKASIVKHKLFPCLYYTYLAPLMPRGVFDVLQKRIKNLIEMLEDRRKMPGFLDVPALYRPQILRILRQWQEEASKEFPPAHVRQSAVLGQQQAERFRVASGGAKAAMGPAAKGCAKERKFYQATGLLPLTSDEYKLYRPELRACIDNYTAASTSLSPADIVSKANKICGETWATNVTFIDLDWERAKKSCKEWRPDRIGDADHDVDLGHDVFDFAEKLTDVSAVPRHPQGLYDYVEFWFRLVATALANVKHRLKIEACVGDITGVLEQIRYGQVGHRRPPGSPEVASPDSGTTAGASSHNLTSEDINEYPHMYDRIHLSNIPDYIGGTLSSFLYASPLTHEGKECYITSTNLRNPPRFPTIASFDNEYITLSAPSDLEKAFRVRMKPLEDPNEHLPTCRYNIWYRQPGSKDLQSLMPRDRVETWLMRLFLKIAIPTNKSELAHNQLIYSPLNITVFFRLFIHLHSIGYPPHWLGGVWTEILSGKITSTARPPKSEPLSIKEAKSDMPARQQSTMPFVAELTTLTALWQPILPFSVPAPGLPLLQDVHKYSVRLHGVPDFASNIPSMILALYDKGIPNRALTYEYNAPFSSLRAHLVDDEKSILRQSPEARKINEEGLHIVTTFKWDSDSQTATFWFRSDVLEKLKAAPVIEQLRLAMWRSDNWMRQSKYRNLDDIHDHGVWINGEDVPMPEAAGGEDEEIEDEDDEGDEGEDEGFHSSYPSSSNPQFNMLTQYLEQTLRAMPGDSADQRMRLAEQLIGQGMSEKSDGRK